MNRDRNLCWEGCYNARDLGGMPSGSGRRLRWGAVVRSDALEDLTADAWGALEAHGIRTIIDLRNDDEQKADVTPRPPSITTVRIPIDNIDNEEFWRPYRSGWQFGTPLYYAAHLARFPKATGAVISAIAHAAPGGVLYHCAGGRDRTGLVTMLLLSLLDVDRAAIAADYAMSRERLRRLFAKREDPDASTIIDEFLARRGTTLEACLLEALAAVDRPSWLRAGGLTDRDLDVLRERLLE
jgi:protein-tyrosine phosphatase